MFPGPSAVKCSPSMQKLENSTELILGLPLRSTRIAAPSDSSWRFADGDVDENAAASRPELVQPGPLFLRNVEPDARRREAVSRTLDLEEADVDQHLGAKTVVPRRNVDHGAWFSPFVHVGDRLA